MPFQAPFQFAIQSGDHLPLSHLEAAHGRAMHLESKKAVAKVCPLFTPQVQAKNTGKPYENPYHFQLVWKAFYLSSIFFGGHAQHLTKHLLAFVWKDSFTVQKGEKKED